MTARETRFSEVMAGPGRVDQVRGEVRLDLDVRVPGLLVLWGDVSAELTGRVRLAGAVDDPHARGSLQLAPLRRRRLRYQLEFTAQDGRRLRLDGWKTVRFTRPLTSMTTLPATVYAEDGSVVGEAVLRFALRDLPGFLATFRYGRPRAPLPVTASRWRGQPGRLEVWYTTLTDPATGTGAWLHQEIVAPASGEPPYAHGWVAVFPPDEAPLVTRLPRRPVPPARGGDPVGDPLAGAAEDASWALAPTRPGDVLYTFPRWAWPAELLPGAQLVTDAGARYDGKLQLGGRTFTFADAPGASARIYGHGNAQRWAWLHADLDDDTVLEIVSAVSTLPVLRRLRPLTFVRLRTADGDLPRRGGLLRAARWRARIGLPEWSVTGRLGRGLRLRVQVRQPVDATLALEYAEPRGERVVCRNCERSDVRVELVRRDGTVERSWTLTGTAHAEVGGRE